MSGSSTKGRNDSRVQEISEITRGLKAIAKELEYSNNCIITTYLRQVEQREDKRPQLSDLRESGTIEQDSDVVMFIFPRKLLFRKNGTNKKSRRSRRKI